MSGEARVPVPAQLALVFAAAFAAAGAARAFDESADGERGPPRAREEGIAYKLTSSYYSTSNEAGAFDVNLRGNLGPDTAWVGYYDQPGEFNQARAGYEHTFAFSYGHAVLGAQLATHGFLGGGVGAEVGGTVFVVVGWSRTNLKPYFNLNFDPNDAVTFGAGARLAQDTTITLFQVRDDRLSTGQRVTHGVFRTRPSPATRLSVDVFHKSGQPDAESTEFIHATGIGVTWDFEPWFARVTWDPNVNFTP